MVTRSGTPVVVFDLDDTLYQERHYVRSGFLRVASVLSRRWSLPRQSVFDHLWTDFEAGVRGDTFDRLLATFDMTNNIVVADLVELYQSHDPVIELAPDVMPVLRMLREAHAALALLTDGHAFGQWAKIRALGIGEAFDHIVVTDELGPACSKPAPYAFEQVMQRWPAAEPDRFIYVADNPVKDFIAPNQLGWRSIRLQALGQLYHHHEPAEPAHAAGGTIATIADLVPLIFD